MRWRDLLLPWAALAAVTLVGVLVIGSVTGVSVAGTWATIWATERWILFLFILHSAATLAGELCELYSKYVQLRERVARLEKEAGIESKEEKVS